MTYDVQKLRAYYPYHWPARRQAAPAADPVYLVLGPRPAQDGRDVWLVVSYGPAVRHPGPGHAHRPTFVECECLTQASAERIAAALNAEEAAS